ncbi:MAG: DUF1624 domain-containing protein [Burkholderiales bacterium]|nr:DUF1624 domain-containing protein [Burkholderiales bacterium]
MMMIAYHFLFDTTYFKLTQFHMLVEPGWILWRDLIVSSFLLITGISLVLAQHQSARGLLRRNLQIGGSAALVSIGSYLVFPASFIYFGILHFNLLASLICAPLRRLGRWTLPLGIVAGLAGILLSSPLFDPKYINWLGFVTHKPITEDYVPLFPWLGVVLVGMAIGRHWQQHGLTQPASLAALSARLPAWLRWLGRHSLLVYLIHQPLLFAGFEAARGLQLIR